MARKRDRDIARAAARSAGQAARPFLPRKLAEWVGVLLVGFVAAVLVAVALSASGVLKLTVRGNWPPFVGAFLHGTYLRSVEFHGRFQPEPPDLTDQALIDRGAGHFGTTCIFCHGGPGVSANAVSTSMEPAPPALHDVLDRFDEKSIFYLIDEGLAMSAMPAWPIRERDDEVWAMVAFVRRIGYLTEDEFQEAIQGPVAEAGAQEMMAAAFERGGATDWPLDDQHLVIESCARCHGFDGQGRESGAFPNLALQPPDYLAEMLTDYATGRKHSGIMKSIAIDLSPVEVDRLARYYASQPPGPPPGTDAPEAVVERGRTLALEGDPARNLQPCAGCHGTVAEYGEEPWFPVLSGQYEKYLAYRLKVWRDLRPAENVWNLAMSSQAHALTDEDIAAVSAFYATQEPPEEVRDDEPAGGVGPGEVGGDGAIPVPDGADGSTAPPAEEASPAGSGRGGADTAGSAG